MWFIPLAAIPGWIAAIVMVLALQVAAVEDSSANLDSYLAAHPVSTTATMIAASGNSSLAPELMKAVLSECPIACNETGLDSSNWSKYSRLGRLSMCNQTMLLDFSLFNSLREDGSLRACTASLPTNGSNAGNNTPTGSCQPSVSSKQVQVALQLAYNESKTPATLDDFEAASTQLAAMLSQKSSNCTSTSSFAYSNSVTIGIFMGSGIQGIASSVLQDFITKVKSTGFSSTVVTQLCAKDGRSSRYSFGIAVNGNRDVSFVQETVATWASGECISSFEQTQPWQDITISVPSLISNGTASNSTARVLNSTADPFSAKSRRSNMFHRRDFCRTVQVVSGDGCDTLAAECGISGNDFTTYNPSPTLCSTLQVGQHVCCSPGDMPDFRPKPNADGTCYTYYVMAGDTCSALAATNSLTNDEIESFNTQTWGWEGCEKLQASQNICLSTGSPPMPAPVANAVCGPQKPGSTQPGPGVDISSLNPCPLNACCDKFGQCGITAEFCTDSRSSTGAPGTSAPGENGCISNCGTNIVVGSAPAQSISIGYFEAFNLERPCLDMKITAMDMTPYTHIHLAFGEVTSAFAIDVSKIQVQWDLFVAMSGFKKVLSLGGWSFSTEPATYAIFRNAVQPGNQDTFVANIVSFVQANNLDGIDIDWEYPAAPDIPGIPAGTAEDASNYLTFFQKLRAAMPSGKTVSFCAPASFWYLRGFHVEEMAAVADYIVYMTYDLHGQWDYANKFAIDGCPAGNCLRSQVNITETLSALSMITKAGVPSNKIAVGVASYGRSFQMTTPGCTGPMCTYTGGVSGAYPGECTNTAGYIANAEINAILKGNGNWRTPFGSLQHISSYSSYFDSDSQSNMAVYDSTQWVGYMDDTTKAQRRSLYQSLNFAGIIDWAIDLEGFGGDSLSSGASSNIVYPPPNIWTSSNPSAGCQAPCIIVFPPYPISATHTVNWPPLTTTLLSSAGDGVHVVTTTIPVPAFTITDVSLQPLTLQQTDTASYKINPVQSITPPSFIYTLPPNHATFPVTTPTPASSTDSNTPIVIVPPVTFQTTPVPVTIQPQPTYSVDYPDPPTPLPPVTVKPQTTSPPDCTGPGCGKRDCSIFGCKPGCGLFGCDGGCGIFGCGGGCGVTGCIPDCPLGACGGPGCLIPGGCGNTQGPGGSDAGNECEKPVTASACTYLVTSYSEWFMTASTRTTEASQPEALTSCATSTACNGQDTATTTTPGEPECTLDPDVQAALSVEQAADQTMINGQQVPLAFAPTNPPGYDGSKFTLTQFGLTETVTVVATSTVTVQPTTKTVTVVVQPTVQASCAYWIVVGGYYTFEVYNIDNWSTDGGSKLKKEEKGCGALTGWTWNERSSTSFASAYFNLPFFMKSGCVERAIVSAGGPKLSCEFKGYDIGVAVLPPKKRSLSIDPPPLRKREITTASAVLPTRTTTDESTINPSTAPLYTPESWVPGNTVTLTSVLTSLSQSIYTTEIVLGSLPPVSGSQPPISTPTSSTPTSSITSSTSSISSAAPTPPSNASPDGSCGPSNGGTTCTNTAFGSCCSQYGYCGNTAAHCGAGCQTGFGSCDALAGPPVSTDGTCSSNSSPQGATCAGSAFGDCCSEYGYCGGTNAYCGTGCQAAFGTCA